MKLRVVMMICAVFWTTSGAAQDVVILGEVHDNPAHHELQLQALRETPPSALVFEMVTPEEASLITPDLADDPELGVILGWDTSGWPDFSFYAPLFAFGTRVPIYGAEVPRDAAQQAFEAGAAAVFGADAGRFGLHSALPVEEQAAREALQLAAHCDALPADLLAGFVEAQRLRDAVLAEAALGALEAHGPPVFVIAGNGHARTDWGVPALISRAAPQVVVRAVAALEAEPGQEMPQDLPYDEVITTAAVQDRPDPCAAFR